MILHNPYAPEFDHFSLKDMKGQRQEWSKIIEKRENIGKRDRLMSFSSFDEGWSVLSP